VIDTTAPTAVAYGAPETFSSGDNSINGVVTGTDFANEIVEVTFDRGLHWSKASSTYVGSGTATDAERDLRLAGRQLRPAFVRPGRQYRVLPRHRRIQRGLLPGQWRRHL
jgi:hypothetical protein